MGKTWLRAPWSCLVPLMPDDLLDAVAAPLHLTTDVVLVFPGSGGELGLRGCRNLKSIAYFHPTLEGRWGGAAGGPGGVRLAVPVERAVFMELLHVMEHGDLSGALEPTLEHLHAVKAATDMLGVAPAMVGALRRDRVRRPHEQADLFALSPSCWRADAEESARRHSGVSGDAALVRVDAALAAELRFKPLAPSRDDRWLLADLPRAGGATAPGDAVLHAEPAAALAATLPALVADLLKEHAGHLVLAGGSVTGAVVKGVAEGSDFDLFTHGLCEAEAEALAAALVARLDGTHVIRQSRCAVTFVPSEPKYFAAGWGGPGAAGGGSLPRIYTLQLITRLSRDRAQIVETFDFAPAKALARWDAALGGFVVEAAPSWREAVRARAFWVDSSAASPTTVPRVFKYIAKGVRVWGGAQACTPNPGV